MVMVIDIETRGRITPEMRAAQIDKISVGKNLMDPEKIRAKVEEKVRAIDERAALSPLTGEVACIVMAVSDDGDADEWRVDRFSALDGERCMLGSFAARYAAGDRHRLITYNGSRFDLPFLAARIAINDIIMPRTLPAVYGKDHIDMYRVLGEQGTLEEWSVALGLGSKEIRGADIPVLVEAGRWDEVLAHCEHDVHITCELYNRLAAILTI